MLCPIVAPNLPPPKPHRFPLLEHNGTVIEPYEHYGFSRPSKSPGPAKRFLYAARDENNERHWRKTLDDIKKLINNKFQTVAAVNNEAGKDDGK